MVAGLHLLSRRLYDRWWTPRRLKSSAATSNRNEDHLTHGPSAPLDSETTFNQRINFDVTFSILLLFALHGFSALKIGLILGMNFLIAKRLPRGLVPAATWIFNIGVLFANEMSQGYKFVRIAELLLPWTGTLPDAERNVAFSHAWAHWLDSHGGLAPRWEVTFNITILRLISFNMDYYWSRSAGGPNLLEVGGLPSPL